MSDDLKLQATDLTRKFSRKIIFENLSFELKAGSSLAITGKNGAGKSTLIKVLANLLSETSGSVKLTVDNSAVKKEEVYKHTGFAAPYLNLYDEFTGYENLRIVSAIRQINTDSIDNVLKRVGLYERRNDLLKIYSSGMKQRLKLAFAVLHNPKVLLLDEPTVNLDIDGVKVVDEIAEEYRQDRILVIATNDEHEKSLCTEEINLNKQNV
jgi:heme exporter protein A